MTKSAVVAGRVCLSFHERREALALFASRPLSEVVISLEIKSGFSAVGSAKPFHSKSIPDLATSGDSSSESKWTAISVFSVYRNGH
jgi:hypothetical protein